MITHWILKVTDGQAKGLGVWKSRFQSWGRRRVSDPSAKLLPRRGAAQWFQMCKIRHKISSLVAISRIFFKQVSSVDWHDFRFRWLHSLHIQNLSNCCRCKYDPSQFPRIFLNSFLEGFVLFGPTVRSGLAADGLTFTKAPLPATRLNMRAATTGIITPPAWARGFSMTPGLGVLAHGAHQEGGGVVEDRRQRRTRTPSPSFT